MEPWKARQRWEVGVFQAPLQAEGAGVQGWTLEELVREGLLVLRTTITHPRPHAQPSPSPRPALPFPFSMWERTVRASLRGQTFQEPPSALSPFGPSMDAPLLPRSVHWESLAPRTHFSRGVYILDCAFCSSCRASRWRCIFVKQLILSVVAVPRAARHPPPRAPHPLSPGTAQLPCRMLPCIFSFALHPLLLPELYRV